MRRTYAFGRIPSPEDSRDFLMAAVLPLEAPRINTHWRCRRVLDQGNEPACVGFSWAHWGIAAPVEQTWGNPMGFDLYRACKAIDGHAQEPGSTVRAGAQVMLKRGRIASYFWARTVDEALAWVGTAKGGPCVFGTPWTQAMCRPGLFTHTIRPWGKVVGGHAYLVCGVDWDKRRARIHNSWGRDWGDEGECWISFADLRTVFARGGEACAATERPLAAGGQ